MSWLQVVVVVVGGWSVSQLEWLPQHSETAGNISPLSGPDWRPPLGGAFHCPRLNPSILVFICAAHFRWVGVVGFCSGVWELVVTLCGNPDPVGVL